MRTALTTGQLTDPMVASLITRYTLAKELNISPKEQDEMSFTMARDLMTVHGIIEEFKGAEMQKIQSDMKKIKMK